MRSLLVVLSLLHAVVGGILHSTDNCIQKCDDKEGHAPVCDAGHYQYDNKCIATECSKTRYPIACETACPCSSQCRDCLNEPASEVCGVDGKTYLNKCEAHCNRVDVECERPCGCWD